MNDVYDKHLSKSGRERCVTLRNAGAALKTVNSERGRLVRFKLRKFGFYIKQQSNNRQFAHQCVVVGFFLRLKICIRSSPKKIAPDKEVSLKIASEHFLVGFIRNGGFGFFNFI